MDDIKSIVKKMIAAGETEENIGKVIKRYNQKNPAPVKKKEEPSSPGYTPSVLTEKGKASYTPQTPRNGQPSIPEAELAYKPNLGLGTQTSGLGSSLTQGITTDQAIDNAANGSPYQQAQSQRLQEQTNAYQEANPGVGIAEARQGVIGKEDGLETRGQRYAKRSKFIYNSLLTGVGSLAAGAMDLGLQMPGAQAGGGKVLSDIMRNRFQQEAAPAIREALVNTIGANMSEEDTQRFGKEFLTGSIGGLAASLPAMVGGKARTALFFLQAYDNSLASINQSDPAGLLSEDAKTLFATSIGGIMGKLETVGFDRIFKGKTSGMAQTVVFDALSKAKAEAVKKGGKVTTDLVVRNLNNSVRVLTDKFAKGGSKVLESAEIEFLTGASQEAATVAGEAITNLLSGEDIFEIDDFASITERVLYAGAQEAVGGGVMGGAASLMPTTRRAKIKETEAKIDSIDDNLDVEDLSDAAKEVLVQEKIKAEDELESENKQAEKDIENLSEEDKAKANDLTERLDKLQEALNDPNLNEGAKASIQKEFDKTASQLDEVFAAKEIPEENKKAIKVLKDLEVKEDAPAEPVKPKEPIVRKEKAPVQEKEVFSQPEQAVKVNEEPAEVIPSVEPNTPQKPRGIRAVKDTLQKVFGLSSDKAEASSKVYDKVMRTIAKRSGKTPTEAYEAVQFVKADEATQQKLKDAKTPEERNEILEGALFQLIGINGAYNLGEEATSNKHRAERMDGKGENPVKIWMETGWQKTANGWVTEIPDGRIVNIKKLVNKLRPGILDRRKSVFKAGKLSDFLDNKDLFKAYPKIAGMRVMSYDGRTAGIGGIAGYDPAENVLYLDYKNEFFERGSRGEQEAAFHSILVHEIQHAIQKEEGMEGGSNLEVAEERLLQRYQDEVAGEYDKYSKRAISSNQVVAPFFPFMTNYIAKKENVSSFDDAVFKEYQSKGGEVQARNVQDRQHMGDVQRKITPPSVTEDVAAKNQHGDKLLYQDVKAAVQLYEDGEAIMHALTDPNVSSPMHELAHIFERHLTEQEIKDISNWSGKQSGTVEFSEAFAEGFETYLQEGKAPFGSRMQKIFDQFREWLNEIYQGVDRKALNKPMQRVYDAMLGFDPKPLTRVEAALQNDPRDWREAVLQRLLAGSAISTKSFVDGTGFGWMKVDANGNKTRASKEENNQIIHGELDAKTAGFVVSEELHLAKLKGHVKDDGTPLDLFLQDENMSYDEGEMMDFAKDSILEGKILDKLENYVPAVENTDLQDQEYQDHLNDLQQYFDNHDIIQENFTREEISIIFESVKDTRLDEIKANIDNLIEGEILTKQQAEQLEAMNTAEEVLDSPEILNLINNGTASQQEGPSDVSSAKGYSPESQGRKEQEARVREASIAVDQQRAKVKGLATELGKAEKALSRNLNASQTDAFGQNKPQSMFDDRAEQQKRVDKKKAELKDAKEALEKLETALEDARDAVGQMGMFDSAIETLKSLKINTKGKAFDASLGIPVALYNGAIETAIKVLELGNSGYRAIQAAKKYLRDNGIDAAKVKAFEDHINEKLEASGINTQEEGYIQNQDIDVPDFKDDPKKSWTQNFYDNTRKKIKEWFDFRDGLGKQFYEMREKAFGARNLQVRRASIAARKLGDIVKNNKAINQKDIDDALRGEVTAMDKLPQEAAALVVEMRAHIDALSQSLIDDGYVEGTMVDTISRNLGEYLHRSYRIHDSKNWKEKDIPDNIKIKAKQVFYRIKYDEVAESMPDATTEEIQEATKVVVENIVKEMFEEARPSFSKGNNTNAKDTGILKHRQDIPVEIRALMGEYTDPINNYMRTIGSLASFYATSKYLNNVKKAGLGTIFFEKNNKEGFHTKIGNEGQGSLSPLNGLYTTPEIAKAFSEAQKNISPLWAWIMNKSALVKGMKTVYSISTHIKNIEGNIGFVLVNGHFNVAQGKDAMKAFRAEWSGLDNKAFEDIIAPLIENNVLGQNVITAELRAMVGDDATDYFSGTFAGNSDNMPVKGKLEKAKRLIGKVINPIKDTAEKAYEMEDAFFKIYGFLNDLNRYSEAMKGQKYNDLDDADKKDMQEFAAELTKNSYATYSRIPEIVKKISKLPFGNFIGFASESYRIAYNSATIAYKEIKSDNPKIRAIGAQRIAGMVTYKGLKYGLMAALGKSGIGGLLGLFADDDEEEQVRKDALRYVAPWSKNSDLLVYPTENGALEYFDFSSYDPFGMQESIINSLLRGEDPIDKVAGTAMAIIEPFTDEDLFLGAFLDIYMNENNYEKNIWEIDDTGMAKFGKGLAHLGRAFEPGTFSSVRRMIEKDGSITDFAYRNYKQDLSMGFRYKAKDANEHIKAANSRYNSVKYKHGEDSPEAEKAAKDRDQYITEMLESLRQDYEAALRLGGDRTKLIEELKNQRLNNNRRRKIINGKSLTQEDIEDD